jgi:hypothetical protein
MPYPDLQDVLDAIRDETELVGFCIKCGAPHFDCEPYGQHRECTACGAQAVYGAPRCLLMRCCQ